MKKRLILVINFLMSLKCFNFKIELNELCYFIELIIETTVSAKKILFLQEFDYYEHNLYTGVQNISAISTYYSTWIFKKISSRKTYKIT
jgi:hypothetical protein